MLYDDFMETEYAEYGCDTVDDVYDEVITVTLSATPEDDYDEFCSALCKKIEVKDYTCCGDPICGWSDYIKRNMEAFREFSDNNWYKNNYRDEDQYICEWLEEFQLLLSGYGTDDDYTRYKELIDRCA